MPEIYSDIYAYEMITEFGSVEIYIVDKEGSKYRPNLILPNLLALKKLKEYLEKIMEKHDYA